jgi:hypothetical protein
VSIRHPWFFRVLRTQYGHDLLSLLHKMLKYGGCTRTRTWDPLIKSERIDPIAATLRIATLPSLITVAQVQHAGPLQQFDLAVDVGADIDAHPCPSVARSKCGAPPIRDGAATR